MLRAHLPFGALPVLTSDRSPRWAGLVDYGKRLMLQHEECIVGLGARRRSTGGEGSSRGDEGLEICFIVSD